MTGSGKKKTDRAAQLKDNLRANLQKRKQQARARNPSNVSKRPTQTAIEENS